MHDLVVREGLEAMARDAAKRFRELVAAGEEIPYEVIEPGGGSALVQYEPLTERFVRDHAPALRELDSFGAACAALEAAGLAEPYLEGMGIAVPGEPRQRAELAGIAFLSRLWMDSSDFSLDRDRLDAAITELEAGGEVAAGEVEVAVPLRGFQMPVSRLVLGDVTIVRADTVDVPAEARASDGLAGSPWEPTYLVVARIPEPGLDEIQPGAGAVESFHRLVTSLRLYKPGGVALGPHAWTRGAGDRWRRIATGAGRPRPGGYRLAETELADFAAFARTIADPGIPLGRQQAARPGLPAALGRAISRFEAGLERMQPIEGLNDHLLALRFLLEGGGPAELGIAMRVAALCAEPEGRDEVKAVVDRAIAIERELWSGEPASVSGGPTPAAIAIELEQLVRAILKDASCAHLGSDLRVTADEILLADGLRAGDGSAPQRGATAEWQSEDDDMGVVIDEPVLEEPLRHDEVAHEDDVEPDETSSELRVETAANDPVAAPDWSTGPVIEPPAESTPASTEAEQEPRPERRTYPQVDPEEEQMHLRVWRNAGEPESRPVRGESPVLRLIEQTNAERAERRERVANLFPRPETTEWNVREIAYDRRRRAEV